MVRRRTKLAALVTALAVLVPLLASHHHVAPASAEVAVAAGVPTADGRSLASLHDASPCTACSLAKLGRGVPAVSRPVAASSEAGAPAAPSAPLRSAGAHAGRPDAPRAPPALPFASA